MAGRPRKSDGETFLESEVAQTYGALLVILKRDIRAIRELSIGGKLPPGPAKNLVEYIKLMKDIKSSQDQLKAERDLAVKARMEAMSEADLQALLDSRRKVVDDARKLASNTNLT